MCVKLVVDHDEGDGYRQAVLLYFIVLLAVAIAVATGESECFLAYRGNQ
jgi:hypothetical protein